MAGWSVGRFVDRYFHTQSNIAYYVCFHCACMAVVKEVLQLAVVMRYTLRHCVLPKHCMYYLPAAIAGGSQRKCIFVAYCMDFLLWHMLNYPSIHCNRPHCNLLFALKIDKCGFYGATCICGRYYFTSQCLNSACPSIRLSVCPSVFPAYFNFLLKPL